MTLQYMIHYKSELLVYWSIVQLMNHGEVCVKDASIVVGSKSRAMAFQKLLFLMGWDDILLMGWDDILLMGWDGIFS
jgi:hypothetical protein